MASSDFHRALLEYASKAHRSQQPARTLHDFMAALKPILAPEQLRKARRLAIELAGVAPEGAPTCRDVPANSHVCAAPSCNLEHCQPCPPLPDTDADLGTVSSLFGAAQVPRSPDASWMPSEALHQTLFAGPCGDSATTQRPTRDATRISALAQHSLCSTCHPPAPADSGDSATRSANIRYQTQRQNLTETPCSPVSASDSAIATAPGAAASGECGDGKSAHVTEPAPAGDDGEPFETSVSDSLTMQQLSSGAMRARLVAQLAGLLPCTHEVVCAAYEAAATSAPPASLGTRQAAVVDALAALMP